MKARELVLWFLVIVAIALGVFNIMQADMQYKIIKIMGETQQYILELIDLKASLWLL